MVSPHAANVTKDSDVTAAEWPVVTKSLLADSARLGTLPASEVNQPLLALMRARKAIADAMLSCQFSKRLNPTKPAVRERLDELTNELRELHARFPLTILENAQGRPRRHIMAGHDTVDRPSWDGFHVED